MTTNYDAIVIGTGQAGPSLVGRLAGAGTVIQRAVHIHPTVSELIPTLLGDLAPLE